MSEIIYDVAVIGAGPAGAQACQSSNAPRIGSSRW